MKTSRRGMAVFCAVTVVVLAAVPAFGQFGTTSTSGTFQTTNQSIWSSGPSFTYNYNTTIGTSFSANPSIGGISCDIFGCFGAQAGLSLSGGLGLNIGAQLDSGTVNASIPFTSTVFYPTIVKPFAWFTPGANFGLGSSSFMTTGPTAGAYADLYGNFNASGYATACASACGTVSGTFVNTSFNQELLALNRNNDGQARILGQQVFWNGTYGPVTFSFNPSLNGASGSLSGFGTATGSSQTDVAHAGMDFAQVIADTAHIPISGQIGNNSANISWDLVSASLTLDTYFDQKFGFSPDVYLLLHVQGTSFNQDDLCVAGWGCQLPIQGPAAGKTLTIIPRYFADASFSNDTGFQLAPGYDVSLLSAQFNLCCGLSLGGLGPLAEWSNNYPLPEISVYDNTFALQGFQEIDGQPFYVTAPSPEPGTLIMFGSGILGLAGMLRRKIS